MRKPSGNLREDLLALLQEEPATLRQAHSRLVSQYTGRHPRPTPEQVAEVLRSLVAEGRLLVECHGDEGVCVTLYIYREEP